MAHRMKTQARQHQREEVGGGVARHTRLFLAFHSLFSVQRPPCPSLCPSSRPAHLTALRTSASSWKGSNPGLPNGLWPRARTTWLPHPRPSGPNVLAHTLFRDMY
jgi:hypothetical protein